MAKGGGDDPPAVDVMLVEITGVHNNVCPRPSPEENTLLPTTDVDKKLVGQFEELTQTPCSTRVESSQLRLSQRLKEDLMRKDAEMEKRKQLSVVKAEGHHNVENLKQKVEEEMLGVTASGASGIGKSLPPMPKNVRSIPVPAPPLEKRKIPVPISVPKRSEGPAMPAGWSEGPAMPGGWSPGPTMSSPVDIGKKIGRPMAAFASTTATLSPVSVGQKLSTIDEDGGFRVSDFPKELIYMVEDTFAEEKETLDISHLFSHKLLRIPETIGDCVSLTVLNLAEQQLETLPDTIGSLVNLVTLDLHSNKLKELPDTVGLLVKLVSLNLHSNQLEELPDAIGNCIKLEKLIADFNQLKSLPESIGKLRELHVLIVHLNRLKRLPANIGYLTKLEELDAHFNHLEHIPDTLCNLTNLKKLDLCSNFTEMKGIPAEFGKMTALVDLNLAYNSLRTLPDTFGRLTNLQKLNLDGNPLVDPPQEVLNKGIKAILAHVDKKKEEAELKANKKSKNPFSRFWTSVAAHPKEEYGSSLKKGLHTYG